MRENASTVAAGSFLKKLVSLCVAGLACFGMPVLAHQVVAISDGDTLTLLVDRRPVRIRIHGIDAPEKAQAFGAHARKSLSDLCWGRGATYKKTGKSWNRVTAHVYCDGVDVGVKQVERGMAWVYERYNKDPALPGLQKAARAGRRGLWVDPEPVPPWEWRDSKR